MQPLQQNELDELGFGSITPDDPEWLSYSPGPKLKRKDYALLVLLGLIASVTLFFLLMAMGFLVIDWRHDHRMPDTAVVRVPDEQGRLVISGDGQ